MFAERAVVASPGRCKRSLAQSRLITRAQWLENSAEVEVAAPLQRCWEMWEDQERIPNWMPWISSVKVIHDVIPTFPLPLLQQMNCLMRSFAIQSSRVTLVCIEAVIVSFSCKSVEIYPVWSNGISSVF